MPFTDLTPLLNLPTNPIGWIAVALLLSVEIFVHELGHLLWAKRFGVGAEEFAIGFGKRLIWREWGGTIYSIRAIPLGGFVKIKGMIAALEEEREEEAEAEAKGTQGIVRSAVYESSVAMRDLSLPKRLLIFSGGVINNVILAFILLVGLAYFLGVPVEPAPDAIIGRVALGSAAEAAGFQVGDEIVSVAGQQVANFFDAIEIAASIGGETEFTVRRDGELHTVLYEVTEDFAPAREMYWQEPPVVAMLMPNQPAERAGMQEGDLILEANGHRVTHFLDLQPVFAASEGTPVALLIARGDERITLEVAPEYKPSDERWMIGFVLGDPDLPAERLGLKRSLGYAVQKITDITTGTLGLLWKIVSLQLTADEIGDNVGGPIQVGVWAYQATEQGLSQFIFLAAMFSMALAIFNILPIPILDGGHCLINIIESTRRRPIPLWVLERIYFVFFGLIVLLAITLVTKDIVSNLWRLNAG